jgi:glutamate racemase
MTNKKKLTFVFTDSGLGGLSIMADFASGLEQKAKNLMCEEIEVIFFNALPESGQGYNRMEKMHDKINTFNNALEWIKGHYKPDAIAIACNTLSAIYPLTPFAETDSSTFEIISSGRSQIRNHRKENPAQPVFVLATPTTLASNAYKMDDLFIFQVSGENLASLIEFDHTSPEIKEVTRRIFRHIENYLGEGPQKEISLFLGCTHYGYIEQTLQQVAKDFKFSIATILNPNTAFTNELVNFLNPLITEEMQKQIKINLRIESQAKIEPSEIESISQLVKGQSEEITTLLKKYTRLPHIF